MKYCLGMKAVWSPSIALATVIITEMHTGFRRLRWLIWLPLQCNIDLLGKMYMHPAHEISVQKEASFGRSR